MTMLAWLFDNKFVTNDCVLCFDGFLIRKKSGINEKILRKLEKHVKEKLKFNIKLKFKSMDEGFKLPDFE